MISSRQKNRIYDNIQKLWVSSCIAVTVGASSYIGYQLYVYFTKVKPIKQEMEERFKEELLKEGRMKRDNVQIPSIPSPVPQ